MKTPFVCPDLMVSPPLWWALGGLYRLIMHKAIRIHCLPCCLAGCCVKPLPCRRMADRKTTRLVYLFFPPLRMCRHSVQACHNKVAFVMQSIL